MKGPPGTPVAQQTELGWILTGSLPNSSADLNFNTLPPSRQLKTQCYHTSTSTLDSLLRKFWELEELPRLSPLTTDEIFCEELFQKTTTRTAEGRYQVRLPFKISPPPLGQSRAYAFRDFLRLEKRLLCDESLYELYAGFMSDYLALGHMELVEDEAINFDHSYYIPHHAVVKKTCEVIDGEPRDTIKKLRVVFNASKKTASGYSLNDTLLTGPKLQNEIFSVILKWRIFPIVFIADIEKMFRQIRVHPEDTDYQRILWRKRPNEPLLCYRLTTVTYGTSPAPFLSGRCLKQHAADHQDTFPCASKIIQNNFYVDDALFGSFDEASAMSARNEVIVLLQKGGFKLRKWLSNDDAMLKGIPDKDKDPAMVKIVADVETETLGIGWQPNLDSFCFQINMTEN